MTDANKHIVYRLIFLTAVVLAVYGNILNHRFVWDDLDVIVKNPLLEHFSNLPKLFFYEDRTGDGFTGYYRPMTYISFMLDRAIWGLNPVGFNITNLLLHIVVVLLFYGVVSALFKKEQLAFVAALIFALHPVAAETVNFHAGGRNTLLSACFALLSLLLYINKKQLPAILCFTVAIFSKEFALLLPAVFYLYDRYLSKDKKGFLPYLPYLVLIICYLTLRSFAVTHGNLLKTIQLSDNLWLIPRIVLSYLKNMVVPVNLKIIYDVPTTIDAYSAVLYPLLLAAVISIVVIFRKKREVAGAACWFFLFLLPVIGIVPLGSSLMADRYAYFSLMGFSLALAYAVCTANIRVITVIMVIVCACYATIDLQRNALWKDLLSLYTRMTKDAPERSIGFTNVGMYYYERGDLANAERYLEESVTKKGIVIRDAYQYLSAVYWEGNKLDKALALLNKMIALEPDNPQPYIMASKICESLGDTANARIYHDKVVAKFPRIEEMMQQRVMSLCREGEKLMAEHKTSEAERKFKEALMMKPDFVPALIDMGSLVAERGDHEKALMHFSKAETLDPANPSIHYNLSMVYELMGRPGEAQAEMKKFRELDTLAKQKGAEVKR